MQKPDFRVDHEDSFSCDCPSELTIEAVITKIMSPPHWIANLLKLRNIIVRPVGLKGESVNLDRLITKHSEKSCTFALEDRHLDFRAILTISQNSQMSRATLSCTTQVKFNNLGGRLYFLAIQPFHKMVVPAMLRYAARHPKG